MTIEKLSRALTTICVLSATLLCASCASVENTTDDATSEKSSQSDVKASAEESTESATEDSAVEDSAAEDSATHTDQHMCAVSELSFEITRDQGAAGKAFYFLTAHNTGDATCVLAGYPGVSFVDQSGQQIGLSAERTGKSYEPISLKSGDQAQAVLIVGNVNNYTGCDPQSGANVKIFPPEETHSTVVPADFQVCSAQIAHVQIDPFKAQ